MQPEITQNVYHVIGAIFLAMGGLSAGFIYLVIRLIKQYDSRIGILESCVTAHEKNISCNAKDIEWLKKELE